jgi:peptidoglycan/LPS O-acetylase OafA/YrhL
VSETKAKSNRFMELEGLRGIAAIMVVIFHFLQGFFAVTIYGLGTSKAPVQHMRFEDNLYGSPLAVFFSGTFAVAIFFVLSGFVLSIGFLKTRKPEIIKKLAFKRYPRLMLPALASILLCWVALKLGFSHTAAASTITNSGWLLDRWNFDPSFLGALKDGVWTIFTTSTPNHYNHVLWTMGIEFAGSFIVFGFALMFAESKRRWWLYGALLVVLVMLNIWLTAFVIGMIFADLYSQGYIAYKQRKKVVFAGLLGAALFLGGYPRSGVADTIYHYIKIPHLGVNYQSLCMIVGASILIYLVLTTKSFAKILQHKRISVLGKYTFSLYLVHSIVLFAFTTAVFIALSGHMGYNRAAFLSFAASVPVLVVLTWAFERYIDAPSVKFASFLSGIYFGAQSISIKPQLEQFVTSMRTRLAVREVPDLEE